MNLCCLPAELCGLLATNAGSCSHWTVQRARISVMISV
jgi:hypothetical protein